MLRVTVTSLLLAVLSSAFLWGSPVAVASDELRTQMSSSADSLDGVSTSTTATAHADGGGGRGYGHSRNVSRPRTRTAVGFLATKGGGRGRPCPANSFVGGTSVLMADGTRKPIERIRVGDMVLATDPATGLTGRFPVTRLITGEGTKDLVAISVAGETLVATAQHSFWVVNRNAWIDARDLVAGDVLRRSDGATVAVDHRRVFTVVGTRVHNLTVAGVHTFYAGDAPVLVHNQGCGGGAADDALLGARGTQVTSKTLLQREKYRVDVENPAPGSRPGQLHLQDDAGGKYLYDFEAGQFPGLPKSLAKQVGKDPNIGRAIGTGRRYLGLE